jgi:hypothetical protein
MTRIFSVVPYRMLLTVTVGTMIVISMGLALAFGSDEDAEPGTLQVLIVWIPLGAAVATVALATAVMRPWRFGRDMAAMRAGEAWAARMPG